MVRKCPPRGFSANRGAGLHTFHVLPLLLGPLRGPQVGTPTPDAPTSEKLLLTQKGEQTGVRMLVERWHPERGGGR